MSLDISHEKETLEKIRENLMKLYSSTETLSSDTVLNGDFFALNESILYSKGAIYLEFKNRFGASDKESVILRIEGYCVKYENQSDIVKTLSIWSIKTNELIEIKINVLTNFNIGDLNDEVIVKYPDSCSGLSDNCM